LVFSGAIVFAFIFLFSNFIFAACEDSNGWYNVGAPYSCCEGNQSCQCQDQEYRSYSTVCTSVGQTCTSYSTVCTEQGQRCASYGTRCATWGTQVCIRSHQECVASHNICAEYGPAPCTSYNCRCIAWETHCQVWVPHTTCTCNGVILWGVCIGSYSCVDDSYCAIQVTSCTSCVLECNGWGTPPCTLYIPVCDAYQTVCDELYLPCASYETYCTGYETYCVKTEQVCNSWQPYCAAYGCNYGVTNTRTVKSGCASVNGKCGYVANPPPSVNNLSLDSYQNTVCGFTGGARVRFNWTFVDPGDTQKDYQIQVDNNSDFSSPLIDKTSYNNSSQMFINDPPTYPLLAWNTVYYWRVQVWDSAGNPSGWFYPPSSSVGPGVSFTTPAHSFPYPSFTSSPARPTLNTTVNFIDNSKCYSSPGNIEGNCSSASYFWDFTNDGSTDSTKNGNATTTYNTTGIKTVTLKITDGLGSCSISKDINIGAKVPNWQETAPIMWLRRLLASVFTFSAGF
jgi:hypothetical protein